MTTEQADTADATRQAAAPETAHIFTAIREVMKQVRGFAKSGLMKGGGASYNFQRYEDMAERLGEVFREQGIMTQVEVRDKGRDQWDKPTTTGSTRWTSAWVHNAYLFTSLVDGTSVHVEAMGEGADSSDKAFNKAMTGAYKNALKTAFTLSTREDDPDDERPEIVSEVVRNDPWRTVQIAMENATRGEAAGKVPPTFTDVQRKHVATCVEGLPRVTTLAKLEEVRDWAIRANVLECPTPNGNALAGALLAAKGTLPKGTVAP
jgi:ERF superfamily